MDFNGFEAGLCESLITAALAGLADFFAAGFLADVLLDCGEVFLVDFLRVILDIRLPFVAFRGSTIEVLRVLPVTHGFGPAAGQV